jgi:hypothetical protein
MAKKFIRFVITDDKLTTEFLEAKDVTIYALKNTYVFYYDIEKYQYFYKHSASTEINLIFNDNKFSVAGFQTYANGNYVLTKNLLAKLNTPENIQTITDLVAKTNANYLAILACTAVGGLLFYATQNFTLPLALMLLPQSIALISLVLVGAAIGFAVGYSFFSSQAYTEALAKQVESGHKLSS